MNVDVPCIIHESNILLTCLFTYLNTERILNKDVTIKSWNRAFYHVMMFKTPLQKSLSEVLVISFINKVFGMTRR